MISFKCHPLHGAFCASHTPAHSQWSVCCRMVYWFIHNSVSSNEPEREAHINQTRVTVSSPHRNLLSGQQVFSARLQTQWSAVTKQEGLRQERSWNSGTPAALSYGSWPRACLSSVPCTTHSPSAWLSPRRSWPRSCLWTFPGSLAIPKNPQSLLLCQLTQWASRDAAGPTTPITAARLGWGPCAVPEAQRRGKWSHREGVKGRAGGSPRRNALATHKTRKPLPQGNFVDRL